MQIGIYDETDPLKTVAYWPPGLETLVAQTLPTEESLFFDKFDVQEAANEHENLIKLLNSLGVKTINLKDQYTKTLQETGCTINPQLIVEQCKKNMKMYGTKIDTNLIPKLLEKDISRYGKEKAITLNYILCVENGLPVANIFYSRDVGSVIFDKFFMARPRYKIRKIEVPIIEKSLETLDVEPVIHLPKGIIECGDLMIHNKNILLGNGMRTNDVGTLTMLKEVEEYVQNKSYKFLIVKIPDAEFHEQMKIMHLDTFYMPVNQNTVVVCPAVAKKCEVIELPKCKRHNFYQYLKMNGYEIIPITKKQQEALVSNFLTIDKNTIVAPNSTNGLYKMLESYGVKTYYVNIHNLVNGYGGVHCMFLQFLRGY